MINWPRCTKISADTWQVPLDTVPLLYFDMYNLLFRFENLLRVLVYVVLKAGLGKDWLFRPIGERGTINAVTKQRMASPRSHAYIGVTSSIPMLFLEFDDLIELLNDERNRGMFQPVLRGAVEGIIPRLHEVRVIRNNLAHFRKVTDANFDTLAETVALVEPAISKYLRELTLDWEQNYLDDAPGIGALQAQVQEQLKGVSHFSIRFSRTERWLGVELDHSVRHRLRHLESGVDWLWVLDPTPAWRMLKKSEVDGSAVFYTSYADFETDGDDVSGNVWVRYVLPWKFANGAIDQSVISFVRALAELSRQLDGEYRRAEVDTPANLKRCDADLLESIDEKCDPFVSQLCPRNPDIIEDWTGTWEISGAQSLFRLPWLDEELSRQNEALQEILEETRPKL